VPRLPAQGGDRKQAARLTVERDLVQTEQDGAVFSSFSAPRENRYYPLTHRGADMRRAKAAIGKAGKTRRAVSRATAKPLGAPKVKRSGNSSKSRAQLNRELREALARQEATAGILQIIAKSASNAQPVFDAVAECAMKLLDCWSAIVLLFDGELVQFGAARGAVPNTEKLVRQRYQSMRPDRASLLGRTLLGREVISIADAQVEPDQQFREYARKRKLHAVLIVPLLHDERVEGALVVTRAKRGLFAPQEVELVRTFSDQAVIAIQNARLFNEAKEALTRQTATSDILRVISQSPTDVRPVFDAIAQSAVRLLRCERAFIQLCDSTSFWTVSLYGPEGPLPMLNASPVPIDPDANFPSRVIAERKTLHLPDWAAIDLPPLEQVVRTRLGISSALYMPLLRDGECIGLLAMAGTRTHIFGETEIALAESFRDQALIAIENTRLFNELRKRTDELSRSLDDLRTAQDRLVQTEKLASLGQLTAGIAHEIKNPLNFVNNFSSLSAELIDELDAALAPAPLDQKMRGEVSELTQMLKSNLEKVVQHGKRADSIVKNMLLHAREGSGEWRTASINGLVEESLNLAYHGARAEKIGFNIELNHDLDPDAGAVKMYPQEITRALLNLISNGFYAATRRKAEERDETFEPVLRATTRNLGGTVEIRIRDNGAGIPPEVREKMFNPFFTTKPAGEGTGLGLSMTHDIIAKQHGGTIDVVTEPGAFTEFIITLPRDNGSVVGEKPV
jgi:two-component system, NtrC family, sensor kinase